MVHAELIMGVTEEEGGGTGDFLEGEGWKDAGTGQIAAAAAVTCTNILVPFPSSSYSL